MAGSFDGPDNIHFATSGVSAAQVSNIHYPNLATDFQFYITKTPMVRLVISENVGIEESVPANLSLASNMPNPFQNETVIPFTLRQAAPVTLEVTDLSGRIVFSENLGTRAAGTHRYTLNGSPFAAGSYQYTLVAGTERLSKRMVIAR